VLSVSLNVTGVGTLYESTDFGGLEWLLPSGNKFEKQSGELFSIDSHSRGVFVGLFFHEYKIKNTKKKYIIALNRSSFMFNN
jgi:hypothetical protein